MKGLCFPFLEQFTDLELSTYQYNGGTYVSIPISLKGTMALITLQNHQLVAVVSQLVDRGGRVQFPLPSASFAKHVNSKREHNIQHKQNIIRNHCEECNCVN